MRSAYRLLHLSNEGASRIKLLHSVHAMRQEMRWLGRKDRNSEYSAAFPH